MGHHLGLSFRAAYRSVDVMEAFWLVLRRRGWSPYYEGESVAMRMSEDYTGRVEYDPGSLREIFLSGRPFGATFWLEGESCFFHWGDEGAWGGGREQTREWQRYFIEITSDRVDQPDGGIAELLDMQREIIAAAPACFHRNNEFTLSIG